MSSGSRGSDLIGSLKKKALLTSESALGIAWEEDPLDKGKRNNKGSEMRACLGPWRRVGRAV